MTPGRSFEISRHFTAHHAESLPANRWSLRHSDHEEVTNHSSHWTHLIRIHTYNGIEKFWNGYNSRKRRLLFFSYMKHWATSGHGAKSVCVRGQESAHVISEFPFIKLEVLNGKPHTKRCQENRCVISKTHGLTKSLHDLDLPRRQNTYTGGPRVF